jgi:hypothetical protein
MGCQAGKIFWRSIAMTLSNDSKKLAELIKKAIHDHVVTNAEYEEILALADRDGVIDSTERALLRELNDMISDKSVKRVP